jgi:hypothetical protein
MCKEGTGCSVYYSCTKYRRTKLCRRNGWKLEKLEDAVLSYVFSLVRSENLFEDVRALQTQNQAEELKREVTRLQQLLTGFSKRKERLFDLFETGSITRDEFIQRNTEHAAQQSRYDKTLQEKQHLLAAAESNELSREHFRDVLAGLEERWEKCDVMQRKSLLADLVEKVVADTAVKIHLRLI